MWSTACYNMRGVATSSLHMLLWESFEAPRQLLESLDELSEWCGVPKRARQPTLGRAMMKCNHQGQCNMSLTRRLDRCHCIETGDRTLSGQGRTPDKVPSSTVKLQASLYFSEIHPVPFGIVQEFFFSTGTTPPLFLTNYFNELPFSFAELFFFLLKKDGKERPLPHSECQVYGTTICT